MLYQKSVKKKDKSYVLGYPKFGDKKTTSLQFGSQYKSIYGDGNKKIRMMKLKIFVKQNLFKKVSVQNQNIYFK